MYRRQGVDYVENDDTTCLVPQITRYLKKFVHQGFQ